MILLKQGEMVLKGTNRHTFEDKLRANIARRLRPLGKFKVYTPAVHHLCGAHGRGLRHGRRLRGHVARLRGGGPQPGQGLREDQGSHAGDRPELPGDRLAAAKTFKVESKRADKTFPMTSIALSQWVGGELDDRYPNLTVDVRRPELTVHLEVRDYAAFVHADPEPGAGGLPVGTSGRALSLLSGGIDSPVASWMMAKRGWPWRWSTSTLTPTPPRRPRRKVLELARLLTPWTGRLMVHVVPFTRIQEELRRSCPEDYFTLLMRRFMMRISEGVARRCGCHAIVTGESLGQVASQTMDAMAVTGAAAALPVFRPWWAWTRRRWCAWPVGSAPSRPPFSPTRTAAPSSPPGTPGPAPGWRTWRPLRPPWMRRAWWRRPWRGSSGSRWALMAAPALALPHLYA